MPKEKVEALVKGGEATPAPPLGPSLSPLGVNVMDVVKQINEKTSAFKGMEVPVKIFVDTATKKFEIEIGTPPVSAMLKKEMKIQKMLSVKEGVRSGGGDIKLDKVVAIAKSKSSISGSLPAKVTQVLGTCLSGGVTVDGRSPRDVIRDVKEGKIKVE